MFALIGAALFLGCPTDAGDDTVAGNPLGQDEGGQTPSAEDQAKALKDALTAQGIGVTQSGATLTTSATADLATALGIPPGVTFVVAAGHTLTVKSGGSLTVSSGGVLTVTDTNLTVESGGSLANTGTITVPASTTLKVSGGATAANAGVINAEGGYTVETGATLSGTGTVNLSSATGVYTAGAGITVTGTVTLEDSASLVLGTTDSAFAGINGTVKVSLTTISGEWVTAGTNTGTVTIAAPAGNADPKTTITAASAATGLTASGAGGTITQQTGANNSLSIAADTVITLGSTGSIRLVSGDNPAKLTFSANSSKVLAGTGAGGTAIDGINTPKIGGKAIVITSLQAGDFKNDSGVLVILGGTTAGNFTASTTAGTDVVIDSTVTAEGSA